MKRTLGLIALLALLLGLTVGCSTSGSKDGVEAGQSTDEPGTDDPGSDDPGSDDPGSDDPGSDDPGSDDPGSDDPGSDDPGSDDPPEDPLVAEFEEEMIAVGQIVEQYWVEAMTDEVGSETYVVPEETYTFVGSTDEPPTCGGEPVTAQNAFFCYTDNTLIYDVEWLYDEYVTIGDTFVYVLIAHEYAHSAQWNLNEPKDPQDSELQADCFAGAVLQWEIEEGTIELEEGDEMEINQTLAFLSNEYGIEEMHGTLSQRATAFEFGRSNGVQGCLYTEDYINWG